MLAYNVGPDQLEEYDLQRLGQYDYVVYSYECGFYDGSGQAVGIDISKQEAHIFDLSHCSCYGPTDGNRLHSSMPLSDFVGEHVLSHEVYEAIFEKILVLLIGS